MNPGPYEANRTDANKEKKTTSLTSLISTQGSVKTSMTTTFPMSVKTVTGMEFQMKRMTIQTAMRTTFQILANLLKTAI